MKLVTYGPNCHGLVVDNKDSLVEILFSYSVPVGAKIWGEKSSIFRTKEKHSVTTSKHINSWMTSLSDRGFSAKEVPQSFFEEHIKVVFK